MGSGISIAQGSATESLEDLDDRLLYSQASVTIFVDRMSDHFGENKTFVRLLPDAVIQPRFYPTCRTL
eukprot:SAG11_NODE_2687_length_3096_cov_1.771104_5_plen_68_part_00